MKLRENNVFLIKDFMEIVEYRITEGCEYGWRCYGADAYSLDSWNGDNDAGHSVGIVFGRNDQTVYQAEAHDYKNQRAYRWVHPDYRDALLAESQERGVSKDQAWDDVDYVQLEEVSDFIAKAQAIVDGLDYDTRVSVAVDLDTPELYQLMLTAHERDITLNKLIESILEKAIAEHDHVN